MARHRTGTSKSDRRVDAVEREERGGWGFMRGKMPGAAYRHALGEPPVVPAALSPSAKREMAKAYAERVAGLMDRRGGTDSTAVWTSSERERLRRLLARWQARADGLDPWFAAHGTDMRPLAHGPARAAGVLAIAAALRADVAASASSTRTRPRQRPTP